MNETSVQRGREAKRDIGQGERERHKSIIRIRLYIVKYNPGKLLNEDKVKMQYVQPMFQQSSSLAGLFM